MRIIRSSSKEWIRGQGYSKKVLAQGDDFPQAGLLLQEVRFRKGESIPPHVHRVQTEVFFALTKGSITIDGKEARAEAGDIIVCEPGEVHSIPEIEEDFSFLVLKIDYRESDTEWF